MSTNIFSADFVATLKTTLEEKTANGAHITRVQLAELLGVDLEFATTLSVLLAKGMLPGYENVKGVGIVAKGYKKVAKVTEPKAKKTAKKVKEPKVAVPTKLTAEFTSLFRATINDLLATRPVVSRAVVANEMGMPGQKTELLLSAALKTPEFADLTTKRGVGGGIIKASVVPTAEEVAKQIEKVEALLEEVDAVLAESTDEVEALKLGEDLADLEPVVS